MPEGIAKTNGRIEATQIDVSAKYAGRLASVNVNEGDEVTAGQEIARISSPETEAQLRGAQAQELTAKQTLAEAEALIAQRKSDLEFANNDVERGKPLVEKGYMTKQMFDQRVTKAEVAEAALHAAEAQREAAQSQIKNAQAEVERIEAILVDLTLVSPRSGRVQYLIHRAGEVVDAGTRILTILDLNDVYMTIYLPAAQAGQLALGDEARMILDPFPQYVVPATVSFVATEAQFTPKSVETAEEREKLMFRVKLQVDPKVLGKYHSRSEDRRARHGFCPHRLRCRVARGSRGEASLMTDRVIAKVEHVSHRYGKTVALNDVTIEIPACRMIGMIGPDGVGKSTLLGLIAGRSHYSAGPCHGVWRRHGRQSLPHRANCSHRLYASGPWAATFIRR